MRFIEGNVDTVDVVAPDLGPIAALWVGPEAGSWRPEEITVTPPGGTKLRFPCNALLGEDGEDAAMELRPLPEGSSVPLGPTAALAARRAAMTPEQLEEQRAQSLQDYTALKQRLYLTTAAVAAAVTAAMVPLAGPEAAVYSALGGVGGVVYLSLLSVGVDKMGAGTDPTEETSREFGGGVLGKAPLRLSLVVLLVLGVLLASRGEDASEGASAAVPHMLQAGAGFLSYKVAVLLTALTPDED